jgi:hypothetical protein
LNVKSRARCNWVAGTAPVPLVWLRARAKSDGVRSLHNRRTFDSWLRHSFFQSPTTCALSCPFHAAMETVFRVPELLNAILQNFLVLPGSDHQIRGVRPAHLSRDDLVSDKERRQTLYRMALTNRTLSRIALPLLWNTIDGLPPLLRLVSGLEYNQLLEAWVSY